MQKKLMLPPTYLALSIVIMVAIHFLFPLSEVISFPWNLLGAIPLAIGAISNLIADRVFKKLGTTVKHYEESTALATSGVFRISRNPMYLGMVLILLGIAVLMGSLTPYAIVVVFTVLMDMIFIRVEEKMLEEKFGKVWLEYAQKVRRWV